MATAGWTSAAAAFPSCDVRVTYPIPVQFPDGSLLFYCRDGPTNSGAGRSNASIWTRTPTGTTWSARTVLFQGLNVPGAGGPGPWPSGSNGSNQSIDDYSNWSPSVQWQVESPRGPHPGRLHLAFSWHRLQSDAPVYVPGDPGPGESAPADITRVMDYLSYAWSDDKGVSWYNIAGAGPATLPFHPLNNTSFRMGLQDATNGYAEWCGLSIDDNGRPHLLASHGPKWWIRHDGTTWVQSTLAGIIDGYIHTGGASSYWIRGELMMLNSGALSGSTKRRVHLWNLTGTGPVVTLSGYVDTTGHMDRQSRRRSLPTVRDHRSFGT